MSTPRFARPLADRRLSGDLDHRPTRFVLLAAACSLAAWLAACDRPAAETSSDAAPVATTNAASSTAAPAEDRAAARDVTPAAASTPSRPAPVQGMPPIRLEPPLLDFGFVAPSSASTGVVKLVNPTGTPLKILAVQPSCKCTTISDLEGKTIPAGGSLDLEATLDAAAAPGPKKAQIRVLVDGYTQVMVVELKAEVALAVRITPPYINAVEGKNQSGRLVVQ